MDKSQNHVRYETLHSAVSYALQKTLDKITLDVFKSAYPSIDEKTLEFVRAQIIKLWSVKAEHEFKKIFHERELQSKLDSLDRIVIEAQGRFNKSQFGIDVSKLNSEELVKCTSVPILKSTNEELKSQLELLKSSNDKLDKRMGEMEINFKNDFNAIKDINNYLINLDSIVLNDEEFNQFVKKCIGEISK